MKTNVSLFSDNPEIQARREQLEDAYINNGIDFLNPIQHGFNATFTEASTKSIHITSARGYYSQNINWNVVDYLMEQHGNLMAIDETNRPYMRVDDYIRVYFKKLDDNFAPQNIPTDHVKALNNCQGVLFGRPMVILYAGWRMKKDKTCAGMYLVEMENLYHYKWVSDLSELSARFGGSSSTIIMPTKPVITGPDISIRATGSGDSIKTGTN